MRYSTLSWTEMEQIVADAILDRYNTLTDPKKRAALKALAKSENEFQKLASGGTVDHTQPTVGGAYALKYHLQRTDNVFTALTHVHRRHPIPRNVTALDIGSGTGATAAGLAYWAARTHQWVATAHQVDCVEPALPM